MRGPCLALHHGSWGGLTCEPLLRVVRLQPSQLLLCAVKLLGEVVVLPVGQLLQGPGAGQREALGHDCSHTHKHNHEGGGNGSGGHRCGVGGEA